MEGASLADERRVIENERMNHGGASLAVERRDKKGRINFVWEAYRWRMIGEY